MFSAEQLLNPIRPDQPAGDDLAFSPELDAIARARTFDDPSLDQGEWVTELKEADWGFVVTRCAALLETSSKDLRLAVWLSEAAAKKHNLRGLGEGLLVLAGLLERFWDVGLYPEADDGDQEQRIGNLSWLLSRIPGLLRDMPVTDAKGNALSLLDIDTIRKSGDERRIADMETARRNTSSGFRTAFTADAQYCLEALHALERAADERLGNDAPGFVSARDAVQNMVSLMPSPTTQAVQTPTAEDGAAPTAQGYAEGAPIPVMAVPPGTITTRAQAIEQLRRIADFFRRTEPYSPVSYFAEKAAAAGEQDLHTWLRSVVKDSASMAHIEELLGVQQNQD